MTDTAANPQGKDLFGKPPITVLGVGNILLTDEGVGVHVINELTRDYTFSDNVQFLDGGTMGMELLHYLGKVEYLLLVDAVSGGEAPGTVYEFRHNDLNTYFSDHISVHEVGIQDILRIRSMQDDAFRDALVIGVEPASLEIGLELSEPAAQAVPEIKRRILEQLSKWNVVYEPAGAGE